MRHIVHRNDRWYLVSHDGLDPLTSRARRRWHPAGVDGHEAEALAARLGVGELACHQRVEVRSCSEPASRSFVLEGDVADLINNEQRHASEPGELGVEPALVMCIAQASHPLSRGGEGDTVTGLAVCSSGTRLRWSEGIQAARWVRFRSSRLAAGGP